MAEGARKPVTQRLPRHKGTAPWYTFWTVVLLVAALILLTALSAKSLWIDELFTIQVASEKDLGLLVRHCIETERRPPLHYLVLHYWLQACGESEASARLPSVFFALLSLPLLARLARTIGTGRLGLWPAALLACAPTFVLYSRMARAYSMTVAVGLLSTVLFLDVLRRPSRRAWLAYVLSAVALLYTDYALLSLIVAQNLYVAYALLKQRSAYRLSIRSWIAGQMALLVLFLPWLTTLLAQTQRPKLEADFARGAMGYLLKLAYPALSLSVGETIFPWHPAAALGILAIAVLFVGGLAATFRGNLDRAVFLLLFLVVPFLFTAILLSSVATDITFINMASRTLFALPFFVLIVAAGLTALPPFPWRVAAVVLLAVAWGASLFNYHTNRDFHNPIYAVPMREIVAQVNARTQAGDVIVSDVDSLFGYYYARSGATTPHFDSFSQSEAAKQAISAWASPRVWLITLGRDRTRIDAPGDLFAAWLRHGYRHAEIQGYACQDERYREIKEVLLKRPDYACKALVSLYVRR